MPPATQRRRTTSGNGSPFPSTSGTAAARSKAKSTSNQQSTLSFRSSKASTTRSSAAKKAEKKEDALEHEQSPAPQTIDIDVDEPQVPAVEINDPSTRILQEVEVDEEDKDILKEEEDEGLAKLEKQALEMSEARIKTYWAAKERERKAPRVHQEGLSVREKVLREFDMSSRYGPSIGIPRLSRWRRAHGLAMEPPLEVLAVLLKEQNTKGQGASQRSILEELIMSSRIRGDNLAEP